MSHSGSTHLKAKGSTRTSHLARTRLKAQESKRANLELMQTAEEESELASQHEQLGRAYALFDAGVNERLADNYPAAIAKLQEARRIFQSCGEKSTNLMLFTSFELGQAAESAHNYLLAQESYKYCLTLAPAFTTIRLRLVNLLARQGLLNQAQNEAREAYTNDPNNIQAQIILGKLINKAGNK